MPLNISPTAKTSLGAIKIDEMDIFFAWPSSKAECIKAPVNVKLLTFLGHQNVRLSHIVDPCGCKHRQNGCHRTDR